MTNLLTKREAAALVGWHPEHVMREARAGRFPKPISASRSATAAGGRVREGR